jgi:hypothetical protein
MSAFTNKTISKYTDFWVSRAEKNQLFLCWAKKIGPVIWVRDGKRPQCLKFKHGPLIGLVHLSRE